MKDHAEASKKYLLYTYEQFLQDDFFIASIINPTPETEEFWANFERSNGDLNEYIAAKKSLLNFF